MSLPRLRHTFIITEERMKEEEEGGGVDEFIRIFAHSPWFSRRST